MRPVILFVEDETDLGNVVKQYLEIKGFDVIWVKQGSEALSYVHSSSQIDIVVLDIQLPDTNGFDLAQQIIAIREQVFFLFLTARSEKKDRIMGLALGAEDYIAKPFDIDELVLRLKVILRRSGFSQEKEVVKEENPNSFHARDVDFNFDLMQLRVADKSPVILTQREVDLLLFFYRNRNKIIKREEILTQLWGENDYFMGRSLDVFISRLRKILAHSDTVQIENVYGVGFIFKFQDN